MNQSEPKKGISKISVKGFKSLVEECSIEIRPLTILAGANSSGKSSIMQPLLLMKQTLESATDYGALRLNGDNISFTSAQQILSYAQNREQTDNFTVEVSFTDTSKFKNTFKKPIKKPLDLVESIYYNYDGKTKLTIKLTIGMNSEEVFQSLSPYFNQLIPSINPSQIQTHNWGVVRHFCFILFCNYDNVDKSPSFPFNQPSFRFSNQIPKIIHVQGFRTLERVLPVTGVGQNFSGDFVKYVASLIRSWQESNSEKLEKLNSDLINLNLAKSIEANVINDTQIELKVSRSLDSDDMVNIVDVGSGVSQVLPVLVALVVAEPDQLVYLEEPEIHLHPLAQANLGETIVNAANRGVRVVLETHSDLLLRRIQSLVAEDKIAPDKAILHWFSRDEAGFTKIISTALNETGAYNNSDFPLDFTDVFLDEEGRYLDAASAKRWKEQNEH